MAALTKNGFECLRMVSAPWALDSEGKDTSTITFSVRSNGWILRKTSWVYDTGHKGDTGWKRHQKWNAAKPELVSYIRQNLVAKGFRAVSK